MTINLATIPERHRSRVLDAYERAREDAELAAAYDALVDEFGCVCVLDEVAERFTLLWAKRITPSRVRTARFGK